MRFSGMIFAALAACVFLTASEAQDTAANASIVAVDGVAEEPRDNVNLHCSPVGLQNSVKKLEWLRNGEIIKDKEDKYKIKHENFTLTVKLVDYLKDLGEYTCEFVFNNSHSASQTVHLRAKAFVNKFDKSKNLVQGDTLTLRCDAYGDPIPHAVWYKDDEMLVAGDRVSFDVHNEIANGTLKVKKMDYPDEGDYTCSAYNIHGQYNSTIIIRVKDKYAALWPFLGICAEVLILCIIIFIYEKRRAKKMAEEDAKEEADHLTNSHANRDDVRQRKV